MSEKVPPEKTLIGRKQTLRALEEGRAALVYVAPDAEARIIQPVLDLCRETGVPVHVSNHPQRDVILGIGATVSDERLISMLERAGSLDLTGD